MVDRILRLPAVLDRVGLSRPHVYFLIAQRKFPQPLSLCGARAIGWKESVIQEWIDSRKPACIGVHSVEAT